VDKNGGKYIPFRVSIIVGKTHIAKDRYTLQLSTFEA
jgi:hypothetical protein